MDQSIFHRGIPFPVIDLFARILWRTEIPWRYAGYGKPIDEQAFMKGAGEYDPNCQRCQIVCCLSSNIVYNCKDDVPGEMKDTTSNEHIASFDEM